VTPHRKRCEAQLPANAGQHASVDSAAETAKPAQTCCHTDPNWPPKRSAISRRGCGAPQWTRAEAQAAFEASRRRPQVPAAEATRMRAPRGVRYPSAPPKRRAQRLAASSRPDAPAAEAAVVAACPLAVGGACRRSGLFRTRRRAPSHRVDYRGLSKARSPYPTCAVLSAPAGRASRGLVPLQGVPSADSMAGFLPPACRLPLAGSTQAGFGAPLLLGLPKAPAVSRPAPHTINSRGLSHTAARGHPCTGSPECERTAKWGLLFQGCPTLMGFLPS